MRSRKDGDLQTDAARITDETAGSEDRKRTSGGVFVAADSNLGAVVGVERSQAMKEESPKLGSVCPFRCISCTSEGWTPRSEALLEAVLKQARTTRHPWLIACDANMCPEDFEKSLRFQREQMNVVASKAASTCSSKGSQGEWIERTYDYVIASLKGKIFQMEVVEDVESRPYKAVFIKVKREKEILEWNEQKLLKVLTGLRWREVVRKKHKKRKAKKKER